MGTIALQLILICLFLIIIIEGSIVQNRMDDFANELHTILGEIKRTQWYIDRYIDDNK